MLEMPNADAKSNDMFMKHGLHCIRCTDRYWAGLSSDLVIEQSRMRSLKSRGGLTRGRGMEESVRSVWVNTSHECAGIRMAMAAKIGLGPTSQDRVDVSAARMKRDAADLKKIVDWSHQHNPKLLTLVLTSMSCMQMFIFLVTNCKVTKSLVIIMPIPSFNHMPIFR